MNRHTEFGVLSRIGSAQVVQSKVFKASFLKQTSARGAITSRQRQFPTCYGPKFAAEAMQAWLRRAGIKRIRIYAGSPWENGYNGRLKETLRREVLDAEWFTTTH